MTQIIEIYGDNFIGKTSYALSLINNKEDIILFIDADSKLSDKSNLINNYPNMYISHTNNIKDIYVLIENIVEYIDLIIIDSLPNLVLNTNLNNLQYDFKLFKYIKDIITKLCKPNKCDLIIINQNRTKQNNKKQSFGVRALGPYYTKRIYIKSENDIQITKDLN